MHARLNVTIVEGTESLQLNISFADEQIRQGNVPRLTMENSQPTPAMLQHSMLAVQTGANPETNLYV